MAADDRWVAWSAPTADAAVQAAPNIIKARQRLALGTDNAASAWRKGCTTSGTTSGITRKKYLPFCQEPSSLYCVAATIRAKAVADTTTRRPATVLRTSRFSSHNPPQRMGNTTAIPDTY
jgi:hypothetical protein